MTTTTSFIPLSIFLLFGIFIFIILGIIIYKILYNIRIKRQLSRKKQYKHQGANPKNVLIVFLSIALLLTSLGLAKSVFSDNQSERYSLELTTHSQIYTSDEINDLKDTELEIYANAYTTGKLSGYTKEEKEVTTDGNFKYTLFKSINPFDICHPCFVLFVEYTGDKEITAFRSQEVFLEKSDQDSRAIQMTTDKAADYYFIYGNFNSSENNCRISIGLYENDEILNQPIISNDDNLMDADEIFNIDIRF